MQRFDHLFGGIEWTVELAFLDLPYALINVAVDEARRRQGDFPFHQLRLHQIICVQLSPLAERRRNGDLSFWVDLDE